jgi:S1-C subfamily serine protease
VVAGGNEGAPPKPTGRSQFGVTPSAVGKLTGSGTNNPGGMLVLGGQGPYQGGDGMTMFGFSGKANGQGVTVTRVTASSRAAAAGLQKGDDIRAIDGYEVTTTEQLNTRLQNATGKIPVMILRNGNLAVVNM